MSISLYDVTTQDKEITHAFSELQSLMVSLDPDQLSDPCIILLVCQMQKEIISALRDTTGRILLLIQEQDSTSKFSDNRH